MFKGRYAAMAFVGMALASTASLVGTEEDDGTIQRATSQFVGEKAALEKEVEQLGTPGLRRTIVVPQTDDPSVRSASTTSTPRAMDDATGYDPVGSDTDGFDPTPDGFDDDDDDGGVIFEGGEPGGVRTVPLPDGGYE